MQTQPTAETTDLAILDTISEQSLDNRCAALANIPECRAMVLWGNVIERGHGLNFRIGCNGRWLAPYQIIAHTLATR